MCTFVLMKESKNKNKLYVNASDFDKEATFYDDNGEPVYGVDIWCYCRFFAEHVQLMIGDNIYDGLSLCEFADKQEGNKKETWEKLLAFTQDGRICDFQLTMQEVHHIHINGWALCNLCMFINEIMNRKLVILLKPTIADTLNEIKELDEVAFTNKDKSRTVSNNNSLKSLVTEALKNGRDKSYETYKFVERKEVFTKELMQIEFFYYLSTFFNKFFQFKRRGMLTNEESDMIGYFMKWFGLSPTIVSTSRLRQLRMGFKYLGMYDNVSLFSIDNKMITVQWQFIRYADWKGGKINPLKHELSPFTEEETISFLPDIGGIDLLKR